MTSTVFSYPVYQRLRAENRVLGDLFAFKTDSMNATIRGTAERVDSEMVSGNYYSQLGVVPVLGRGIMPADDARPGAGCGGGDQLWAVGAGFWALAGGSWPDDPGERYAGGHRRSQSEGIHIGSRCADGAGCISAASHATAYFAKTAASCSQSSTRICGG